MLFLYNYETYIEIPEIKVDEDGEYCLGRYIMYDNDESFDDYNLHMKYDKKQDVLIFSDLVCYPVVFVNHDNIVYKWVNEVINCIEEELDKYPKFIDWYKDKNLADCVKMCDVDTLNCKIDEAFLESQYVNVDGLKYGFSNDIPYFGYNDDILYFWQYPCAEFTYVGLGILCDYLKVFKSFKAYLEEEK